jgi:hypothetical protein
VIATDLSIGDIGRRIKCVTYPSKNKTARPRPETFLTIDSIYAHANGNILLNGGSYYLHADTPIVFVDDYNRTITTEA